MASMSDLSFLETYSNKELHAKCLEFGLPNIPVTDSSRNVILRRLRATITGVPQNKAKNTTTTKKTTRRETVHSSKVNNAKVNPNRISENSPSRYNNNNNRRTIAAPPGSYKSLGNSSVRSIETTTTVSDVGSQSEDDDYFINGNSTFKSSVGSQYLGNPNSDTRQRRSVSLSKSGVLTTSYTREVDQPHYTANEQPVQDYDEQPQSYTYRRPEVASTHTLPSYKPHVEHTNWNLPRKQLTQTAVNSTSYSKDTADYPQPRLQQATYNPYSGSTAPFNSAAAATNSTIRQRQTIGDSGIIRGRLLQPTYSANTLYPQLSQFYDQQNNTVEPMQVDTDSESEHDKTTDSPYISHFSRQLNAEKRSSPLATPRPSLVRGDLDSPNHQFRALLRSLDQHYHIKFYFCLAVAVMIATMIYVMLTP